MTNFATTNLRSSQLYAIPLCSHRRPLFMPCRRLLEGVGGAQERLLIEGAGHELDAHRQPSAPGRGPVWARWPVDEARRHRDARDAGDVNRQGEDVAQVHLEGVVQLLAEPEGGRG